LSGDSYQPLGFAWTSGDVLVQVGTTAVSGGPLGSGVAGSGSIASGAVQGFFGTTRQIASGTIGASDFGSGAVVAGAVGSGAVRSGNIASGSIGRFHIASGQLDGFELGSGAIVSGRVASGQIGFGHLANGAVQSGTVGSGQLFTYHLASGATATASQFGLVFASGTTWNQITAESVSGVRAVSLNQSGALQIAMASVSGTMPAIGIVVDNALSGIQANVYMMGTFQFTSGLADYSGWLGQGLLVGRSGHVVTMSGSFNSGGLLSGDVYMLKSALDPFHCTTPVPTVMSVSAGAPPALSLAVI